MDAPAAPLYDDFIVDLDDDTIDDDNVDEDLLDLGFLDRNLSPISLVSLCAQKFVVYWVKCLSDFVLFRCANQMEDDVPIDEINTPGLCELCSFPLVNTTVPKHMRLFHPGCRGPCDGFAYGRDGVYRQGMFVGLCGTSSSSYLMCTQCRDRYLLEKEAKALRSPAKSATSGLPYAKLLQLAPDLLGSSAVTSEKGNYFY